MNREPWLSTAFDKDKKISARFSKVRDRISESWSREDVENQTQKREKKSNPGHRKPRDGNRDKPHRRRSLSGGNLTTQASIVANTQQ